MLDIPISLAEVEAARERIRPYLTPSPVRRYPTLDYAVGHDIQVTVKHENHLPTQSCKVRGGLAALTALDDAALARGVIAASTGNHGQAIAYAAHLLGADATVCVPLRNNPEKNDAIRMWGAHVHEEGANYDEAVAAADRIAHEQQLTVVHATNNRHSIAGAGTMTLELLEQAPDLEALVLAVGGGAHAAGAIAVAAALKPRLAIYGVQSTAAPTGYNSWHARRRLPPGQTGTIAEGIATCATYDLTFPALLNGLQGFVVVSDIDLLRAIRTYWTNTHNLAEAAGAAGLAGLRHLHKSLACRKVGLAMSGGNCDAVTAAWALGTLRDAVSVVTRRTPVDALMAV